MARTNKNGVQFNPDYAVPPGDTLLEVMEAQGLDQTRLAALAGLSRKTINEIVQAKGPLTAETAVRLEAVLGLPASFWNNLEANYREALARIEARNKAEAAVSQAKAFPLKELVRRGHLHSILKGPDLVLALQKLFGVAELPLLKDRFEMAGVQFRASANAEKPKPALYAWLLDAEKKAAATTDVETTFDKAALVEAIPMLRQMGLRPLQESLPQLQRACARLGAFVVHVPCYPGVGAHGATFWYHGRPVIVIGDHYKREDILWFTFFHELHHVLSGGRKVVYVEFGRSAKEDAEEQAADTFAADTLLERSAWEAFCAAGRFDGAAISDFAGMQGVHPGVVVGRLQHERRIRANQCVELLRRL